MSKIAVPVEIKTDDLIDSLCAGLSDEALVRFVKSLDRRMADWGFTKKLHTYFVSEIKQLEREERSQP